MTKKQKLLEWVTRAGPLLESQVVGSGMSKALNDLLLEGKVEMIAHPTVKERGMVGDVPATGIRLRRRCIHAAGCVHTETCDEAGHCTSLEPGGLKCSP